MISPGRLQESKGTKLNMPSVVFRSTMQRAKRSNAPAAPSSDSARVSFLLLRVICFPHLIGKQSSYIGVRLLSLLPVAHLSTTFTCFDAKLDLVMWRFEDRCVPAAFPRCAAVNISFIFCSCSNLHLHFSNPHFTEPAASPDINFVPKQPKFSEPAGFSLGVPVPDVLKNLTFAEEALIARIQVAAAAKKLKFGDRSLSGHVSFFDRTANVTEVATVLPNLAANLQILEFTKQVGRAANHTFRDFRVRRHAVQAALLWLCTHSPAYIGITIDQARIDALPVDGQIQAQVVEVQDDSEDVDLGPAAAQRDPAGQDPPGAHPAGSLGVRQDARQIGSIVEVISDVNGTLRLARITHIEGNANADALVAVEYLDDIGGLEADLPIARITIEIEADHTGVIDAPHTTTEAATASLAGLAAAAQATNAAAAAAAAIAAATAAATAQSTPHIAHRHVSEFLRWEDTPFFFLQGLSHSCPARSPQRPSSRPSPS